MLFALAHFDLRVGNQLVWTSEKVDHGSLPGIEFKMIPSGLHNRTKETIYFVCGSWYGVAHYESRITGNSRDSETVLMYSLAALVPMTESLPWSQEPFLKIDLAKFLDTLDTSVLPIKPYSRPDPRAHPVLATSNFIRTFGPMVFEIWKAGLARSRTLLASLSDHSLRSMCQFTYIASQISSIPSDVAGLLPHQKQSIPVLYNVGVNDLQRLQSSDSFWATTTEQLLLTPSRDACDCYTDQYALYDLTTGSPSKKITPTWRDRHRFGLLVKALNMKDVRWTSGFIEVLVDSTANGMIWWASAGESTMLDRDDTAPLLNSPSPSINGIYESNSDVVALIGLFQQYSRQFIRVISKIAKDDDPFIRIGIQDIAAMGLDPFAKSDRDFIQRFSLTWWDKPVVFVGACC